MKNCFLLFIIFLFTTAAQAQTSHVIESGNFFYTPMSLTINAGDTVTWTNVQGFHNVNMDINTLTGMSYNNPESFETEPTGDDILLVKVFDIPGTYQYDCSVGSHAANGMVGTLIVEGGSSTEDITEKKFSALKANFLPQNQAIEVSFQLDSPALQAQLSLSNLSGMIIDAQTKQPVVGTNKYMVGCNNLSGLHIISLHVNGAIETQKVFVH